MVNIRSTRMRSATEARNTFNELLGEAERGMITHVVKGSRVAAHIVPANARIIDDTALLELILITVAESEATYAAENAWGERGLWNAGDSMGRLLAWAWQTDRNVFARAIAIYHRALEAALGQHIFGPTELVPGIETALGVGLSDSEIREVSEYLAGSELWSGHPPAVSTPFERLEEDATKRHGDETVSER